MSEINPKVGDLFTTSGNIVGYVFKIEPLLVSYYEHECLSSTEFKYHIKWFWSDTTISPWCTAYSAYEIEVGLKNTGWRHRPCTVPTPTVS